MSETRSCRFCRKQDTGLLKYDVRHYAHTDCFLAHKGFGALLALPVGALFKVRAGALTGVQLRSLINKIDRVVRS